MNGKNKRKRYYREPKFFDQERYEYLQKLLQEFETSKNKSYRRQTLANLANFGYNPENWQHFHSLSMHSVFLKTLDITGDDFMALIALKGLCNIAWDVNVAQTLMNNKEMINMIVNKINRFKNNDDFIINALLLLIIIIDNNDDDITMGNYHSLKIFKLCLMSVCSFADMNEKIGIKNAIESIIKENDDDVRMINYCCLIENQLTNL